jgi:hypothetical protein
LIKANSNVGLFLCLDLIEKPMTKQLFIVLFALATFSVSCNKQCRKTDCHENGRCYEGECLCEKWYSGDECELLFNRNYDGIYKGSYRQQEGLFGRIEDSIIVDADQTIPNRLMVDQRFYYDIISDSSLIIPAQTIYTESDTLIVEGIGRYDADWIRLEYSQKPVRANGVEEQITFTGEKD